TRRRPRCGTTPAGRRRWRHGDALQRPATSRRRRSGATHAWLRSPRTSVHRKNTRTEIKGAVAMSSVPSPNKSRRKGIITGAPTMSVEERLKPTAHFKPEVASLNMGSMNFGLFPMLGRYREFKYDWERPYLAGSDERIFKNTFKDIQNILETCRANDTRFEIECYDIGHLSTLRHSADRQLTQP